MERKLKQWGKRAIQRVSQLPFAMSSSPPPPLWPSQVLSRISWLRNPVSSALWSRAIPQGRLPSLKLTRLMCDTRRPIHQLTMSEVNVTKAGTSTHATRACSPHWQTSTRSLTKIRRLLVMVESRQRHEMNQESNGIRLSTPVASISSLGWSCQ